METPPLNDHITNKYWAGLFTDLSIEQTYTRDIKGNGGLTRGRGMEEGTRLLYMHSITMLYLCVTLLCYGLLFNSGQGNHSLALIVR